MDKLLFIISHNCVAVSLRFPTFRTAALGDSDTKESNK